MKSTCFSFRYWAYDDYQADKNTCLTHYRASFLKYSYQPGNRHMPNNKTKNTLHRSSVHNEFVNQKGSFKWQV
jgi:hypothetical protein